MTVFPGLGVVLIEVEAGLDVTTVPLTICCCVPLICIKRATNMPKIYFEKSIRIDSKTVQSSVLSEVPNRNAMGC